MTASENSQTEDTSAALKSTLDNEIENANAPTSENPDVQVGETRQAVETVATIEAFKPEPVEAGSRILDLLPLPDLSSAKAADPIGTKAPSLRNIGIAASLAVLAALAGGLFYDRSATSHEIAAKSQENKVLASTVNTLKERLDALESAKSKDETAELRKLLGEVKQSSQATRDFGAALSQLSTRVEHIERDQSAHLDKVSDKLDRDSAARMADIASRLDKLEKKAAGPVVAAAAPVATKAPPSVSNETTGSIDRPVQRLRGFSLEEVRDGFAIIVSRDGPQSVAPGDFIPGAGKVSRIERRGREWVVVTNLGIITEGPSYY